MNTDEIITMCERLARKYRNPSVFDDLVSEGVLAVYERLADKSDEYPASLYRRANKAMHDYINIKSKAVTIPLSNMSTQVSKGKDWGNQTYSKGGKETLSEALSSTTVCFDETFMVEVPDCTDTYERKDFREKAMKNLNERESEVIRLRYFIGLTQDEVCEMYEVSRQQVSIWEKSALLRMSKL